MKSRHSFMCGLVCGVLCMALNRLFTTDSRCTISNDRCNTPVVHQFSPALQQSGIEFKGIAQDSISNISNISLICWVMTCSLNLHSKAIHVKQTWAKRCDQTFYASDKENATFPTIPINVKKGRKHLTMRTMQTFDYIYKHHLNEADWFMKADDDTYVLIENLKYFLSSKDPSKPFYFGHHFNWQIPNGYHSGGSGYVISRKALELFGKRPSGLCALDGGAEDVKFGDCMRHLNITPGDTRDKIGRYTFYPYQIEKIIDNKFDGWYYEYAKYGAQTGMGSLSNYPISFHYIKPYEMYAYEYFFYHLRAFGRDCTKID